MAPCNSRCIRRVRWLWTATIAQAGLMVVPISDNRDAISLKPKETKGNSALPKSQKQNVGNVSCSPGACVPIIGSSSNPGQNLDKNSLIGSFLSYFPFVFDESDGLLRRPRFAFGPIMSVPDRLHRSPSR
jgi:hypothetical protein